MDLGFPFGCGRGLVGIPKVEIAGRAIEVRSVGRIDGPSEANQDAVPVEGRVQLLDQRGEFQRAIVSLDTERGEVLLEYGAHLLAKLIAGIGREIELQA